MEKNDMESMKKEMIDELKGGLEESLLEEFVEHFELWKGKMKDVNSIIEHVDSKIPIYTFNEFCQQIIVITKKSLNSGIDYEKLFLTGDEYAKLSEENSESEEDLEEAMEKVIQKKMLRNLMKVLYVNQMKDSIKHKLQEQFIYVEQELDKSLEIASEILKKYEEEI